MGRIRFPLFFLALAVPLGTQGAELAGVLRDNRGNGLGGISVNADIYFTEGSTQAVATTDAAGRFSMTGEAGLWSIEVPAADLNVCGFLSVSAPSLTVTGRSAIRLTTRKLDFTHRLGGRLVDEVGEPLAGHSLRARIWENNALFETNLVTSANGSFTLAAVPAVWSLDNLRSSTGSTTNHVLGERRLEVELENSEPQVTLVAPKATATISVTTSNLHGWEIVATAQASGATYRLTQTMPCCADSVADFPVFDGVWTIAVTNRGPYWLFTNGKLPEPVSVAVTGAVVSVAMNEVTLPSSLQQVQRVRTVTAGGQVVINAEVSASLIGVPGQGQMSPPPSPQPGGPPPPPPPPPGAVDLSLTEGRWRLTASTAVAPDGMDWTVSCKVVIASNVPPPEVTLVFPEPYAGPLLGGTVRTPAGSGLASRNVSLRMADGGTNYGITAKTDALGQFGVRVLPGRWLVEASQGIGPLSSVVVVSNQDVRVDFDVWLPVSGAPVPVNTSVVDEGGPPELDTQLTLRSGTDILTTNGASNVELLLRPGIWSGYLQGAPRLQDADPYTLFPWLRWRVCPGPPTNVVVATRRASCRIEGRLRDEQGRLLATGYASAWTCVHGTNFWSSGSIASGYFSLNVFPGEWQVGASASSYPAVGQAENLTWAVPATTPRASPPTSYYTEPPPRWVGVSTDLVRCDFVTTNIALPVPATLVVRVFREDGGDVSDLIVYADGLGGSLASATDGAGIASLAVPPGRLAVTAGLAPGDFSDEQLLWPSLSLELTAPSNHVVLVVRRPTGCIRGTVVNGPAFGLQPIFFATAQVNGTNYSVTGCADSTGHYSLPAVPGVWTVGMEPGRFTSQLNDFGIQSATSQSVVVPPVDDPAPADFTLTAITGDFREARFLSPTLLPDGSLQLELHGVAALTWRLERSEDLSDWTPVALLAAVNRSFALREPLAPSGRAGFYRVVWVQ